MEQVSHHYHLWRDRLAQAIRGGKPVCVMALLALCSLDVVQWLCPQTALILWCMLRSSLE